MKSTGVVRKLDQLGRIVVPKELRGTLGMDEGDALEIFVNGNQIILQKYAPNVEKDDVVSKLMNIASQSNNPNIQETLERAIKLIK
jgi:transcriptional pleiotropic regulator of transition state genes